MTMGGLACGFFFSGMRRHTRCSGVSWTRRCVNEAGILFWQEITGVVYALGTRGLGDLITRQVFHLGGKSPGPYITWAVNHLGRILSLMHITRCGRPLLRRSRWS